MHDVVVDKAAHDVHNRVDLADIRKKLVAEALALRRAAHQSRDVDKLNRRGRVFLRVVHLGQLVQPLVRHGHHADVRLNCAERIVRRLRSRVRDRVEQCALADIRQAHDS